MGGHGHGPTVGVGLPRRLSGRARVRPIGPRGLALAAGWSVGLASACEDPALSLPPLAEVGAHLRVGVPEDAPPVCGGTWPYMDRYVGVLKQLHDVPWDYRVDYYWLPNLAQYDLCPLGRGCTYQNTVYSEAPLEEHELVHAARSFYSFSYSFIEEGAAEYWGTDDLRSREREGTVMEAMLQADATRLEGRYYELAGHFVSYLVAEHGDAEFLALSRKSEYLETFAEFEAHFAAAYRFSIEEAVEGYRRMNACPRWLFRSAEGVCESQPIWRCKDGEADFRALVSISCDEENTIGPRDGEIFTHIVLEIPVDSDVVLHVSGPEGTKGFIRRCKDACMASGWRMFDAKSENFFQRFQEGRYVLRLSLPEGTRGEVEVVGEGLCSQ